LVTAQIGTSGLQGSWALRIKPFIKDSSIKRLAELVKQRDGQPRENYPGSAFTYRPYTLGEGI